MKIVIIGLGTAGFAAALAIKKKDRKAGITFIDNKPYDLLHCCGLPYALEGKLKIGNLKHGIGAERMDIDVISKAEVEDVDAKNKKITYNKNNKNEDISYDKLIITTGASPFMPIEGAKGNVFTLSSAEDAEAIEKAIKNAKTAAIIGAGAIGLETAYALNKRGLKVVVIEMLSSLFPRAIDKDMSEILEEYLEKQGIRLLLNKKIEKIGKNKLILKNQQIEADLIIAAAGVKPNIELAKKAGIKTEKGIVVNDKLECAKDIYAAGDCIQTKSLINQDPYLAQTATTAYKQGTIAGINSVGGNEAYKGALSTFVSVIGDLEVAATGFNSHFAKDAVSSKAKSKNKPEWFPGAADLTVKIIADKKGKILGAQAVGKDAAPRINIISTAIKSDMSLKELSEVELAYCPAVSQTYDVLQQAADLLIRRL